METPFKPYLIGINPQVNLKVTFFCLAFFALGPNLIVAWDNTLSMASYMKLVYSNQSAHVSMQHRVSTQVVKSNSQIETKHIPIQISNKLIVNLFLF